MMLSQSQKIRACRAILGMTQGELCRATSLSEGAIIQIENGSDLSKAQILVSFFAGKGLFLSETGISTVDPSPHKGSVGATLSDAQIMEALKGNPYFLGCHKQWSEAMRARFAQVINAFAENGFDIWNVNMNGQIRIGYKPLDGMRGHPFAFIDIMPDTFSLLWHASLDVSLSSFSLPFFDERAGVNDDVAVALGKHLKAERDFIPDKIKELSAGRLPSDYPEL